MKFLDCDICYRVALLRKLHFVTVTYFLEVQIWNCYIFETATADAKNVWETYVESDICHRMVQLRKIAFRDINLLFEG